MKKITYILLLTLIGITVSCTQWALPEACNEPTPTSINLDNNATTKIVTCSVGNSSATWVIKNSNNVIVKPASGVTNNFTFGATDFPPGDYIITASGTTTCGFRFDIPKTYTVICTGSNPTDITFVPSVDKSTTVCTLISDDNLVGETWTFIDKESGKRTSVVNGINVSKVTITNKDYPSANYTLEVTGKTKCGTIFKFEKDFKVDYFDLLNIGLPSGISLTPVAVKIGMSGNIYVVGNDVYNIYLVKYDKFGKFIQTIQLTSSPAMRTGYLSFISSKSIAIDNDDNLYITGLSSSIGKFGDIDIFRGYFVARWDKNGKALWARSIDITYTININNYNDIVTTGNSVSVNSNGFVYVTGDFSGKPFVFGSSKFGTPQEMAPVGKKDIFVAAYTRDGILEWVQKFGGLEDESASVITSDLNGDVYVTGYSNDLSSLKFYIDGGTVTNTNFGGKDIFIIKLSRFGTPYWVKTAGGTGDDVATSIGIDGKSNLYFTGSISNTATFGNVTLNTSGTKNLFISKYNTFGDVVWAKSGNSDGNININQILVDASGNSYIEGEFDKAITFGSFSKKSVGLFDGYVTKYSSDGNIQWLETIGGAGNDYMNGIVSDNGKNIITNVRLGSGLIFEGKSYSANTYLWRLDK